MKKKVKKIFISIFAFVLISAVIYLGIAAVLILTSKTNKPCPDRRGLSFEGMPRDFSHLPKLRSYEARDGTQLAYRHYSADSDKIVVLIHGSSGHSSCWLVVGGHCSGGGLAIRFAGTLSKIQRADNEASFRRLGKLLGRPFRWAGYVK